MGSPCAAVGTRFVDRSGKSNPSEGENSVCGSMNRQNQKKTFLCCRRRSACRCKQQSLPCRPRRHRHRNRQINCSPKSPAPRQSATLPRIAGCWLRRFCWGVRQPVCYRPYAMPGRQSCCGIIWKRGKGCLHRAVCKGRYSFSAWNIWLSALWSACFWYWDCLPLAQ